MSDKVQAGGSTRFLRRHDAGGGGDNPDDKVKSCMKDG